MQEQNDLQSTQGNRIERLDNRKFSRLELAAQIVGSIFVLLNFYGVYFVGLSMGQSENDTDVIIFNILLSSVIIVDIIFLANIKKPRRMRSVLAEVFDAFFWLLAGVTISWFLFYT